MFHNTLYGINNWTDTENMVVSKKYYEKEYILFVEIYMYLHINLVLQESELYTQNL